MDSLAFEPSPGAPGGRAFANVSQSRTIGTRRTRRSILWHSWMLGITASPASLPGNGDGDLCFYKSWGLIREVYSSSRGFIQGLRLPSSNPRDVVLKSWLWVSDFLSLAYWEIKVNKPLRRSYGIDTINHVSFRTCLHPRRSFFLLTANGRNP